MNQHLLTVQLAEVFTQDELTEYYYTLDNEGLFYGWTNGSVGGLHEFANENGYNPDSIQFVETLFRVLENLVP